MADQFVARLTGYKGENEYLEDQEILVEITERDKEDVEIALNLPVPGKPRIYLRFSMPELIRHALRDDK